MAEETIYSQQDAFFLEIQGMDWKIREPVGWNKTVFSIQRDLEKHGVDVSFPSKDSELLFSNNPEDETGNRSKLLIDAEYDSNGQDADIILKFGTWDGITFTELTRQKIDLTKGYVNGLHITKATATDLSFKQKLLDYYDAQIRLEDTKDVLGSPLPGSSPLAPVPLNMHTQVLKKKFNIKRPEDVLLTNTVDYEFNPLSKFYWIQYGFPETVFDEGVENFNLPCGISVISPLDILKSNFKATESGGMYVNSIWAFAELEVQVVGSINWAQITYLVIGDGNTQRKIELSNTTGTVTGADPVAVVGAALTDTLIEYVRKNDNIYLYTVFELTSVASGQINEVFFQGNLFSGPTLIAFPEFNVEFRTVATPTINNSYRLKDAIAYMFKVITGLDNVFVSDIFFDDPDGPGYNFHLVNGYGIRQIYDQNRSPSFSPKDAFAAANMKWNLGENVEVDDMNNETIVWEEVEYFYQDHEIIDLSDRTANFEKITNKDLSINLAKFDYPKISVREGSGGGSIDAINTQLESSLPIETAFKKYQKVSKWRTEGTDIEQARRTSVLEKESTKVDDDIFIVSSVEDYSLTITVSFLDVSNSILVDFVDFAAFIRTSRYAVTGTASNNKTYTFDLDNAYNTGGSGDTMKIPVNEDITTDELDVSATFTAIGALSRQDEEFDKAAFVDESEVETPTTDLYNLILQPIRALIQHGKWLNAASWYKEKTNLYNTLKQLNADNFRTQLNALATHKYGDLNTVELTPRDGVAIEDCYDGKSIIKPNILSFQAEISRDEFLLIKQSMQGQGLTPYGYFTTKDNDGNNITGYLLSLEGNPNDNFYDVQLLERGDFYG